MATLFPDRRSQAGETLISVIVGTAILTIVAVIYFSFIINSDQRARASSSYIETDIARRLAKYVLGSTTTKAVRNEIWYNSDILQLLRLNAFSASLGNNMARPESLFFQDSLFIEYVSPSYQFRAATGANRSGVLSYLKRAGNFNPVISLGNVQLQANSTTQTFTVNVRERDDAGAKTPWGSLVPGALIAANTAAGTVIYYLVSYAGNSLRLRTIGSYITNIGNLSSPVIRIDEGTSLVVLTNAIIGITVPDQKSFTYLQVIENDPTQGPDLYVQKFLSSYHVEGLGIAESSDLDVRLSGNLAMKPKAGSYALTMNVQGGCRLIDADKDLDGLKCIADKNENLLVVRIDL